MSRDFSWRTRVVGAFVVAATAVCAAAQAPVPYRVDAGAIAEPLAAPGDVERGRALLAARDPANCILCHAAPGVRFAGDLAPPLDGVGARLTPAQLRLRLVDSSRINPATIMPAYYRSEGLTEVATAWRGKPVLTAQQVEDLVVYLSTLR